MPGKCSARRHQGFTLIELMIVVLVIAVLAAIAIPAYQNYMLRSKIRLAQSDLLALSATVENFRQRTLSYPTTQAQAMRGWTPAASTDDFTFAYTTEDGGYELTATAGDTLKKASGCELAVDQGNTRTTTEACATVGVDSW